VRRFTAAGLYIGFRVARSATSRRRCTCQELPPYPHFSGFFFGQALTIPGTEDYMWFLGVPPPGAMARLRSPSLFTR